MAKKEPTEIKVTPGRLEIVSEAISCLLAGSLYVILFITLPLNFPIDYIVVILGVALLLVAPILLILTYKDAFISKAEKFLRWVKFPIFVAAILSIPIAMGQIISLLSNMDLHQLADSYLVYTVICMALVIVAEILALIKIYKR
jgi:CDP-diglyceride synthetase